MGFAGISVPQLTIILLIVIAIFGTKRLKTLGGDLGGALRSFRRAMNAPDGPESELAETPAATDATSTRDPVDPPGAP